MNDQQNPESKNLVTVINGQPFTTTLIIAEGVGNQHKNVLAMVRQYQADLERYGQLAFETRVVSSHGAGQPTEFAHLNERQATLLLSYMRNTDVIRAFKMAMVDAFFAMAEELQHLRRAQEIESVPVTMAIGNFRDERDRPAVVPTVFGPAYVNLATYYLCANAARRPDGPDSHLLSSALASRTSFNKSMPPVVISNHKLKMALLKANPLWSDIMYFRSMSVSNATISRLCGCHPATVRRHLRKMEESGLFDDPLAGLEGMTVGVLREGGNSRQERLPKGAN